jgi:hypothetical protein
MKPLALGHAERVAAGAAAFRAGSLLPDDATEQEHLADVMRNLAEYQQARMPRVAWGRAVQDGVRAANHDRDQRLADSRAGGASA